MNNDTQADASTKHTPGPWVARLYPREYPATGTLSTVAAFIDCGRWKGKGKRHTTVGGTVASVSWTGTGEGYDAHANARLIAAAPELLSALRQARESLEEIGDLLINLRYAAGSATDGADASRLVADRIAPIVAALEKAVNP